MERGGRHAVASALQFQLLCRQAGARGSVNRFHQTYRQHPEPCLASSNQSALDRPRRSSTELLPVRMTRAQSSTRSQACHVRVQFRSASTRADQMPQPQQSQSTQQTQPQPSGAPSSTNLEDMVDVPIITLSQSRFRLPEPLYKAIPAKSTSYRDLYYSFGTNPMEQTKSKLLQAISTESESDPRSIQGELRIPRRKEEGNNSWGENFALILAAVGIFLIVESFGFGASPDQPKETERRETWEERAQRGRGVLPQRRPDATATGTASVNETSDAQTQTQTQTQTLNVSATDVSDNITDELGTNVGAPDLGSDSTATAIVAPTKTTSEKPERQVFHLSDLLSSSEGGADTA